MPNSISLYNQVQKENELGPACVAFLVVTLAPSSCLSFQRLEYHFSGTDIHAWDLASGGVNLTPYPPAHLPGVLGLDHVYARTWPGPCSFPPVLQVLIFAWTGEQLATLMAETLCIQRRKPRRSHSPTRSWRPRRHHQLQLLPSPVRSAAANC